MEGEKKEFNWRKILVAAPAVAGVAFTTFVGFGIRKEVAGYIAAGVFVAFLVGVFVNPWKAKEIIGE